MVLTKMRMVGDGDDQDDDGGGGDDHDDYGSSGGDLDQDGGDDYDCHCLVQQGSQFLICHPLTP